MGDVMAAEKIIAQLQMKPHPEGGYYVETFRDDHILKEDARAVSTAIYYLLEKGDYSHWHRVDAVEIWHFYAGAPLALSLSEDGLVKRDIILGINLAAGERPQVIIPRDQWQSARSLGDWTLVGCTVAPGFQFEGFEMAPRDWFPGKS
ncbi:MAG: cupin domain-containing protein [Sneathiella sp.]|nr:cupin domain-containing protein [Sneathiella sp.]